MRDNYKIRKLNPPELSDGHILERITCERPARDNGPRIEGEYYADKVIVHNYGHGGAGWSLGPGSAKRAADLLCGKMEDQKISKETSIAVLGVGALSLFVVQELNERGYTNLTIIAESFDNLTSHKAVGLWGPSFIDKTPELEEIEQTSFKEYQRIARDKNCPLHKNVKIMPFYRNEESKVLNKYLKKPKEITLEFWHGARHENMYCYDDAIFMDTSGIMESYKELRNEKEILLEKKKINSFNDINQRFIINCTGVGSKELARDSKVYPALGHTVLLKGTEDLNYMLADNTEANSKRYFGFFPKRHEGYFGALAGTCIPKRFDEKNDGSDKENEEEFKHIIERGNEYFYNKT